MRFFSAVAIILLAGVVSVTGCKKRQDTSSDKVSVVPPSYFKPNSGDGEESAHTSRVAKADHEKSRKPSSNSHVATTHSEKTLSEESCAFTEIRGTNPGKVNIRKLEWERVNQMFESTRTTLGNWLQSHQTQIPAKTFEEMKADLAKMKIHRPPSQVEPDLSWRGITVLSYLKDGTPTVRMGDGFVKMVHQQPQRAQFEMARVMAQVWSPCKMKKTDGGATFKPMLQCLAMSSDTSCKNEEFSEEGWATSTVIAEKLFQPGCKVPALAARETEACLKELPLLKSTKVTQGLKPLWQEAGR
ncbi:hypothetical protein K2X30_09380 [bacterium]|jgi:hypothetical protein|nr:hypothetical protein [bacterium]